MQINIYSEKKSNSFDTIKENRSIDIYEVLLCPSEIGPEAKNQVQYLWALDDPN